MSDHDHSDGDPADDVIIDPVPATGEGSLAPVWMRGLARIIDFFVIGIAISVVWAVFGIVEIVDDEAVFSNATQATLIAVVVWGIYEVAGTARGGRMLGKFMFGVRVRRVDRDVAPVAFKAMTRWLVPAVVAFLPLGQFVIIGVMVVYLSAILHPQFQGFHDRAAKTLVVRGR
ncbi:MAG: RDD family protein [Acidimicrobiales bacterium]